jgi:hypothetical protein
LIITSTASGAPGVRGKSLKLYVIVPSRTPFTTESILRPLQSSDGAAIAAAHVSTKSRLRMLPPKL